MKELTDFLDKYGVEYTIDGEHVLVPGDLEIEDQELTRLPESFGNLKVGGGVYLQYPWLADNDLTNSTIPRMSSPTIEADWCFIDGIVREIISRKTVDGLTVLKTPFDFIVGDGDYWAHGKSLEEAIEDYRFKLLRQDPEQLKGLDLDNPMSHSEAINIYRAITGACREGIRQWMNGKDLPDPITIRQVIDMTSEDYGGREFAEFFEVGR